MEITKAKTVPRGNDDQNHRMNHLITINFSKIQEVIISTYISSKKKHSSSSITGTSSQKSYLKPMPSQVKTKRILY